MQRTTAIATLILAAACVTGCHIDEDKHGDSRKVKIDTPFGEMRVNNKADIASIGLPLYPGAVPAKKTSTNGEESGNDGADVNMSFGSFQLKVKAASYKTDDSPQRVFDFYKKALGRYGNVIQCRNDRPVGTPTHTNEGLTCEDKNNHNSNDDSNSSENTHANTQASSADSSPDKSPFDGSASIQLKAGSKKHQHIVDINPDSGGARFGLVSLDLPIDFSFGDKPDKPDKPDRDDKQ